MFKVDLLNVQIVHLALTKTEQARSKLHQDAIAMIILGTEKLHLNESLIFDYQRGRYHNDKVSTHKKNTGLFGNFGGVFPIPKTIVILNIALKTPLNHLKIIQIFPT